MAEPIAKPIKPQRSLREWYKERGLDLFITLGGMVAVLLATVYLHFWAPPSLTKNTKVVVIPQGKSFHEIARILEDQGIIRDRRSFYLLARIEGALSKVKAGEYEVHTRMTPGAVLSKLLRGEVIQYPIVIPEGYNIYQIGDMLEQTKVCSKKLFLEKVQDPELIQSLALEGDSLEGYLFPDTYNFPKELGEEQVIRQMVSRFKTVWSSLARRAEMMGLSRRDALILASMIEKEARDDLERRFIAAVFHNRLNRGMALQSDPTAIYGLQERRSSITRGDLQRRTPYNTYIISGLPKGPIANPYNGGFARADILNPVSGSAWDIIEVKSSTEVKDVNLLDLAFQAFVYSGAGLNIRRCYLMHVDRNYVRRGAVDPKKFFKLADVTKDVSGLSREIEPQLEDMFATIRRKQEPEIKIGPHCSDPYACPLTD